MANSIFSGLRSLTCELAFGSSSLTACVSSGAVMMKITSSTSMTSISGTMLISAIGALALLGVEAGEGHGVLLRRPPAAAGSGRTLAVPVSPAPVPSGWPIETKVCSS